MAVLSARVVTGWSAGRWYRGDAGTQTALADAVVTEARRAAAGPTAYRTRMERFDGQSAIAIHQMIVLGLGQTVLAHPELRDRYLPAIRASADHLADPATLHYATEVYGHHGVVGIGPGEGHAYLGYVNLGLSMLRLLEPANRHAALNDRLTETFARNLEASPQGLIETYPGETWPPDVAAVVGSIGLHARATGRDRSPMLARWAQRFEACALHASGLLVQQTKTGGCKALDAPRGSGTAVAAYFLSFATPELARRLYEAMRRSVFVNVLGFGGMREYAPGFHGEGDGNAGPIVFGVSVGATGFGLAPARAFRDEDAFVAMMRSTSLFGLEDGTRFAAGGLLGNALLLAMLTAEPR